MKSQRYRTLLAANPENELFKFSLAQALMEEGNREEAIEWLDACIQEKPDWMMASILKSKCLITLDRKEDAQNELRRALDLAIEQHHEAPEMEVRKLLDSLAR